MADVLFIIGTDTGVGKTVLTVLLTRHLHQQGRRVRAVKPFCSGGRGDAGLIRAALCGAMSLDAINPWNFAEPLAPVLVARSERLFARAPQVRDWLRGWCHLCDRSWC